MGEREEDGSALVVEKIIAQIATRLMIVKSRKQSVRWFSAVKSFMLRCLFENFWYYFFVLL